MGQVRKKTYQTHTQIYNFQYHQQSKMYSETRCHFLTEIYFYVCTQMKMWEIVIFLEYNGSINQNSCGGKEFFMVCLAFSTLKFFLAKQNFFYGNIPNYGPAYIYVYVYVYAKKIPIFYFGTLLAKLEYLLSLYCVL